MGKLIFITVSLDAGTVLGQLLFEDGEHPEPRRINVGTADTSPGFTLTASRAQAHWDGRDPYLREAHRLVSAIVIPAEEAARREAAVRTVIHSGHLEGFHDDLEWQAHLWQFARGEISSDELQRHADDIGPDDEATDD